MLDWFVAHWVTLAVALPTLVVGYTIFGIAGFGAHSRLHTAKILRLSEDMPIVIELVDSREKIEAFLPLVDHAIGEGLATLERVQVRFYRGGAARPSS